MGSNANVLVKRETLRALVSSMGAGLIGYVSNGVADQLRSVGVKILNKKVNVKDFGAVGDGVADDTVAINSAFVSAGMGVVYIPAGIYKISAPIITYGSWYGDGRGTEIRPFGNFEVFNVQSAHLDGGEFGFARGYCINFSYVTERTILSKGHWFNKGATNTGTSSIGGFRFSDIWVYSAYHAFYQSASDISIFWNVSFQNLMILHCDNYGIYLDASGNNGTLLVSFRDVVVDGNGNPTSLGSYFNSLNQLTFNGVSTGLASGSLRGGAMAVVNCAKANVDMQCENFSITSPDISPVVFINSHHIELNATFTTISTNVGEQKSCAYVYVDANTRNLIVKSIYVLAPKVITGTVKKLSVNLSTPATIGISMLDKTILKTECLMSGAVEKRAGFFTTEIMTANGASFESSLRYSVSMVAMVIYPWVDNNSVAVEPQPVLLMVSGTNTESTSVGFVDLVLLYASSNNVYERIISVISSNSVSGAAARTYRQDAAGNLLCAVGIGTYFTRVTAVHGYAPYR